jgi:serine/threonine protein kinase
VGPGTELDGFVIEEVAGRGGMGVVYRARQTQPDRIVAIKVIAGAVADDPEFRARFQRESSVAAEIEHPNVIPVYAVGEARGVLYIAMRFVEGVDLRGLLARERRLAPLRAAAIADQVAQALDAAHARGLVHRDVKPGNILISTASGRDHVYLSDFGLSRHIEGSHALTGTGAFVGTIDYVAPEQARGERVDARTDVYSLGCVLFHALTGTVPFPLDNDIAKLYAHDAQPPPSPLARCTDLPLGFDGVLARAMAKAPDQRYPSAGDLGRAALAAASDNPLSGAERSVAVEGAAPQAGSPGPPSSSSTRAPSDTAVATTATPTSRTSAAAIPASPRRRDRRRIITGALGVLALGAATAILVTEIAVKRTATPSNSVARYEQAVGAVCGAVNQSEVSRAANARRLATRLSRATTAVAQRNALLDSTNEILANAEYELARFRGLAVPRALIARERVTAAAWERIVGRLRGYAQGLDAAHSPHDLLATVNTLPAMRTALSHDGVTRSAGLTNLGGGRCTLNPPIVTPTITLRAIVEPAPGPGPSNPSALANPLGPSVSAPTPSVSPPTPAVAPPTTSPPPPTTTTETLPTTSTGTTPTSTIGPTPTSTSP